MQMFVAELSTAIEKAEFEESWNRVPSAGNNQSKVAFTFVGRKVSAIVDLGTSERWPSDSFYRTFSAAVRQVNRACNIRWL
jgi:hypothetical protein